MPRRPVASDYYGTPGQPMTFDDEGTFVPPHTAAEGVAVRPLGGLRARAGSVRAPLAPVNVLILYGLWPDDDDERDTTNDVTDDEIGAMM